MSVHDKMGVYKPKGRRAVATVAGPTRRGLVPVPSKPSIPCVCEYCGVTFLVTPHRIVRGVVKFCSAVCKYASMRQPRIECTCLACGKQFNRTLYDVNRGQGKYCSYACHNHGKHHPSWKGGRRLNDKGYVRQRTPDSRDVLEHRAVMERYLGRSLATDEIVHHINGDKADNRIENLQVMTHAEHTRHHNLEGGNRYDRCK
jgi:hypothetical protein